MSAATGPINSGGNSLPAAERRTESIDAPDSIRMSGFLEGLLGEAGVRDQGVAAVKQKPSAERLRSLDAVRGLNVMLMVLVDNIGGVFNGWVNHSPVRSWRASTSFSNV